MRFSERQALLWLIDFYRRVHGRPACQHPAELCEADLATIWDRCNGCGVAIVRTSKVTL